MRAKRIFIDGEAGTTGLGIRDRLAPRADVEIVGLDPDKRKDPSAKRALLQDVDLAVFCLPDAAARETLRLVEELGARGPRVLDASTAHRVAPGWVYGFPELSKDQPAAIAAAAKVANPGCYPTGAVALLRPLIDAGLLPPDYAIAIHAISGYSGGGRSMIAAYESGKAPRFELYALDMEHKHVAEIELYGGLARRPIFLPSVGDFKQGMLVVVPLHLRDLPNKPRRLDLEDALARRYAGARYVRVIRGERETQLEPESLNGSNDLELRVFGNEARGHAALVARLDNLGKGASGAAAQNIELMLELEPQDLSAQIVAPAALG